jgi:carbon storage regulator
MLVLRRKAGQSLMIGEEIEIELLEVNSQSVKLGIRAPRETMILRKELKIAGDQNRAAAELPALPALTDTINKLRG